MGVLKFDECQLSNSRTFCVLCLCDIKAALMLMRGNLNSHENKNLSVHETDGYVHKKLFNYQSSK